MRGKILEYEAKTILNKGIRIGRAIARDEERKKILAENEEMARAMIRDRMDFSLVAKYTRLPMPRICTLLNRTIVKY